jgi:hypothetical protein
MRRLLPGIGLACGALLPACASAPRVDWRAVAPGIELARVESAAPGAARVALCALRVDLDAPGLDVFTTPGNGAEPLETTAQTTPQFVAQHDLAGAVNAMFFQPCCAPLAEPKDLRGLAVSEGALVSPRATEGLGRVVLAISTSGRARIVEDGEELDLAPLDTAVSGSHRLLRAGVVVAPPDEATGFLGRHPRTVAGAAADGTRLYLVVIDGRQPGWSDGATLREAAAWLLRLGARDGLNLDGGGSSTMVVAGPDGAAQVVNRPAGGLRYVGSHLGLRRRR